MNMLIRNNGTLSPRRIDLFSELNREFNRVSNEVFGAPFFKGLNKHKGYPLVDAIKENDSLILQYTVPGVKKENLNIEILDDELGHLLIVSGKLSNNYIFEEDSYHIREMSSQDFRRIVRLPDDVDEQQERTELQDGILTITFKLKSKEIDKPRTRKISIK